MSDDHQFNEPGQGQFYEGQEVEVWMNPLDGWRKAKIVTMRSEHRATVQFPDSSRVVFDAQHIRATSPPHATHPTAAEQSPSYRAAMRDAGRGRLLP